MDWLKIGSALFLGAMIIFLFPRMMQAVKHAPKGSHKDWLGFFAIIAVIALFVLMLIKMV